MQARRRVVDLRRGGLSVNGWLTPSIHAWIFYTQVEPVWFVITQEDVRSQEGLDGLLTALADLGSALRRDIGLSNEWGNQDTAFLTYDVSRDRVVTHPLYW